MSYAQQEVSNEDGRQIQFYRFTLAIDADWIGAGVTGETVWRYTSAEREIMTPDGVIWKPAAISDDGAKQTGESVSDAMTITCPITLGPVAMHLVAPPSRPISLHAFRKHEDDDEMIAFYVGEISQVNLAEPGTARITCETLSASMLRDGLRLSWQKNCPYAVYDHLTCKVDKEDHRVDAVVLSLVDNLTLESSADLLTGYPAGHWNGGFVVWYHPVRGAEFRMIERMDADRPVLFSPAEDLAVGTPIVLYPGCSRTTQVCNDTFDNLGNYGGVPHMPGKSPFSGDPIF